MDETLKTKIIWYDVNVNKGENIMIQNMIKETAELFPLTSIDDVLDLIQGNPNSEYFVITSGKNGQELVNSIHDFENVNSIVIFCLNLILHKTWSEIFTKVLKVTSSITEVMNAIKTKIELDLANGNED
jgi:hypothetical protein